MEQTEVPARPGRPKSFKSFVKSSLLPVVAAAFIKTLFHLIKWEKNDLEKLVVQEPTIFAFWHGRQLLLAPLYSSRSNETKTKTLGAFPLCMLISSHADGVLISKAIGWFGISTIHGSSSRNGGEALRHMIMSLEEGVSVAITPDGPRGPAHRAKAGVVKLAGLSGKKIIPASYSTSSYWQLNSWDGMIIPKPFSRGVCLLGKPIVVPPGLDDKELESWLKIVEFSLNELDRECEKSVG